ncbi:MAG TPA: hypothetical protein PKE16_16455 [Hyphomicrobium sp.]|nr:hypothetical protein [Hyphomicrobium sp.]
MSKITFALAAALLAGTPMSSVANADAVRLGFGFPLGSFVAHSNENYSGSGYRRMTRPRNVQDNAASRKIAKVKRPRAEVVETNVKSHETPAVQTTKLEGSLPPHPVTTAIEKTPVAKSDATSANTATSSITATEPNGTASAKKTASTDKPIAAKADMEPAPTATQHICRRYSPAIAALIDVPCE